MDIASAAVQLIEGRDALGPEAQSRLDNTFLQTATTILQTAQRNNALAQLLTGNPGPVPRKVPADTVGLTSARRDLLAKERAERPVNRVANHAPESVDEKDPGLLPPPTASPRPEESGSTKRTRGRTMDFGALHTGTTSKKGKL